MTTGRKMTGNITILLVALLATSMLSTAQCGQYHRRSLMSSRHSDGHHQDHGNETMTFHNRTDSVNGTDLGPAFNNTHNGTHIDRLFNGTKPACNQTNTTDSNSGSSGSDDPENSTHRHLLDSANNSDFRHQNHSDFPPHNGTDFLPHNDTDFPSYNGTNFPRNGTDFPHNGTDLPPFNGTGLPRNGSHPLHHPHPNGTLSVNDTELSNYTHPNGTMPDDPSDRPKGGRNLLQHNDTDLADTNKTHPFPHHPHNGSFPNGTLPPCDATDPFNHTNPNGTMPANGTEPFHHHHDGILPCNRTFPNGTIPLNGTKPGFNHTYPNGTMPDGSNNKPRGGRNLLQHNDTDLADTNETHPFPHHPRNGSLPNGTLPPCNATDPFNHTRFNGTMPSNGTDPSRHHHDAILPCNPFPNGTLPFNGTDPSDHHLPNGTMPFNGTKPGHFHHARQMRHVRRTRRSRF